MDFWSEHPRALADIIIDALKKNDLPTLRGIQCFSEATRWTVFGGVESIINTIFHETINCKRDAKELRKRLKEDEDHYKYLGTYDAMVRRMKIKEESKIPFRKIKSLCKDLSARKFLENLALLEKYGYIATDRSSDWDNSYVWLPKELWNGFIEDVLRRGKEESIYCSAIGYMIAHSITGKAVRTLKPIVIVLNRHPDGETTEREIEEAYHSVGLPIRRWYDFKERDATKTEDIRAIVYYDGHRVIFNREMVQANRLWRERTNQRLRYLSGRGGRI